MIRQSSGLYAPGNFEVIGNGVVPVEMQPPAHGAETEPPEVQVDISPAEYHYDCGQLGKNLVSYCVENEIELNLMLTAARGGLTPAENAMKVLGMCAGQLIVANLQQYGLTGTQLTGEKQVSRLPDPRLLRDLGVVYVDELNDRGGAVEFFERFCMAAGVASFTVATVYQKPRTRRPSDVTVRTVPNHYWLNVPSDLHGKDPRAHLVVKDKSI